MSNLAGRAVLHRSARLLAAGAIACSRIVTSGTKLQDAAANDFKQAEAISAQI